MLCELVILYNANNSHVQPMDKWPPHPSYWYTSQGKLHLRVGSGSKEKKEVKRKRRNCNGTTHCIPELKGKTIKDYKSPPFPPSCKRRTANLQHSNGEEKTSNTCWVHLSEKPPNSSLHWLCGWRKMDCDSWSSCIFECRDPTINKIYSQTREQSCKALEGIALHSSAALSVCHTLQLVNSLGFALLLMACCSQISNSS